jgi:hypothetical protein
MEQLLRTLVWETAKEVAEILFLLAPAFLAVWRLRVLQNRYRQKAVAPFTGQPLRPPGESLRLKVQELDEKLADEVLLLLGLPCLVAAAAGIGFRAMPWPFLAGLFLLIALYVTWRGRRLRAIMQSLWRHRLGFDGERVVGEELNQLLLDGYRVFHDLPFDGFNIDHVVVGSSGVYAVETKTKRKQTDAAGKKMEWWVTYDGAALEFPRSGRDTRWLDQAVGNARTLSDWLSRAVGETVAARPILVLPGWLIERKARGAVNVLNEKEVRHSFPRTSAELSPELLRRITYQLEEKCQLPASE